MKLAGLAKLYGQTSLLRNLRRLQHMKMGPNPVVLSLTQDSGCCQKNWSITKRGERRSYFEWPEKTRLDHARFRAWSNRRLLLLCLAKH
jgi:hypothetical protein